MTDHKNPDPPTRSKNVPSDASPQADAPVSSQLGGRSKPVAGTLEPSLTKCDSLPGDVGLFWAKSGDSLPGEIGPVWGLLFIESLEQVDVSSLTPSGRERYEKLRSLAPSTRAKYEQRFARYMRRDTAPPRTARARSSLRAALAYGFELNTLQLNAAVADIWAALLAKPIELPRRSYFRMGDDGSPTVVEHGDEPTVRRRSRLKKLPKDFVVQSVRASGTSGEVFRGALLVLALTGCRPGEINSCLWHLDETAATLRLDIRTSKVRSTEPPRWRYLTLRTDASVLGQLVGELAVILQDLDSPEPFADVSSRNLENLCTRLSKKLWPKLNPGLNPTCFRARLIADLKADGVPRETIAVLMGHVDTDTAKHYGHYGQGTAGDRSCLKVSDSEPSERSREVERH